LIEQSRSGEHWESVEIPIRRKNGEVRITLWNSANIYAADAVTLTAVIAQGQDITERVRREQETMRNEQAAKRVQEALLSLPETSNYLDIAVLFKPFGFVGGDLYFLDWRYDGNLLRGFLVDITGHGLETALYSASLHVLLREVNEKDLPLAEAMRWLNRRCGAYFLEGIFAGALGFELDMETRQLRWVCAGLPEVWLATQSVCGAIRSPGMFFGIRAAETFDVHTLPIEVGDCFYFMTDGLSDLLQSNCQMPLAQFPRMLQLLEEISLSVNRRDDATAVCIKVLALPQSQVHQAGWPRVLHFNGYGDYQRLKGEVGKILAEITGLQHSKQEIAVHEALANAMECRDGVSRQHKASIRFNKIGNRLIVRVKTSRLAFAGNSLLRRLKSQPAEMFVFVEDAAMGRGIPIMMCFSDKMTYNSEGTELLLAWKI
jgi:anti-sigma regulatory factor (Ser/Thr protein kinase)